MEIKTMMVRMRLSTFKTLKQNFPPYRGESMANYFERIAHYLETGAIK